MSCEASAPLMTERARHKEITLIVFVILTGVFIAIVSSRYQDTLIPHDSHEQARPSSVEARVTTSGVL